MSRSGDWDIVLAAKEIGAKILADECACDKKNPSGRCCLGEVNKAVKKGLEIYGMKTSQ